MKISLDQYKNKVRGCWIGKNVGGTLGAPFECKRGVLDVTYYTHDLTQGVLPNDDLDLQLVWLNAAEKHGKMINSRILGEYWLSYIVPNWAEYGAGKNNMRMGIVPPLSGYVNNKFRDSNGAFIRSEIWACLAPGHPDIAVKYAFEDAVVDHSHEGVYAEVFFAAIQSAAFVESDTYKLIDIGLSYLPDDCGSAKAVRTVIECYRSGMSWQEARIRVLTELPGSFGIIGMTPELLTDEVPVGEMGWDAPSNVGITIIGWLYGEGDFGKSICIANNCGEDTDCTAATLGAIMGIIGEPERVPSEWLEPIGDEIKTLCINLGDQGLKIPKTVTELTDRILKLTPIFLGSEYCDYVNAERGYTIETKEDKDLYNHPKRVNCWVYRETSDLFKQSPFMVHYDFQIFSVYLDYRNEPFVSEAQPKRFRLVLDNQLFIQQWLNVKWHLPEGWTVSPGPNISVPLEQYHCNVGYNELFFELTPNALKEPRYDLIVEITSAGRPTKGLIPIVLLNVPQAAEEETVSLVEDRSNAPAAHMIRSVI